MRLCSSAQAMRFSNDFAGIPYILMALFQPPLRVVVMAERMRHPGIALGRDLVASRLQQFAVFVRLITAQIVFCSDDVGARHALEGFC